MRKVFFVCLTFAFSAVLCVKTFGETSSSASSVAAAAPAASVAPAAPMIPATASASPGSPAAKEPQVAVAAPSAPPQWAQELIVAVEKLPVIGPFVSKALLYLGILGSIVTMAVGFILAVLNTLMGVLNIAGLVDFASKVAAFRDGKIMYWLKFLSLFNAQKKSDPPTLSNS